MGYHIAVRPTAAAIPGTIFVPRYFIDTEDGDATVRDDEGDDYADLAAARDTAIASLPGMADEKLPDGEHRVFKATVRNEADATVYVATLTFHGSWMAEPPGES